MSTTATPHHRPNLRARRLLSSVPHENLHPSVLAEAERQLKYTDFIDIYAALDDNERQRYERDYPTEAQIMTSFAQRFRDEGVQQGMQQGMKHGEALALIHQMQRKFGAVPDATRERVESADTDTLLEWLDRILTADSIDEVLH